MYKIDIPVDYKEAAAIERRRNQEEQRKGRIFNAKARLIGVDIGALEQQVKDRKQMTELERRRNEAFAADAKRYDLIAQLLQSRQEYDIRELNAAVNEFRMLHQQPSSRREWDLYDPDALKKDRPVRVGDNDPRCGMSSLQKFDGEDLNSKARSKVQNEQMRQWAEQQMREKQQANDNQMEANRLYELKMRELDQRACELQNAEEECRRAINRATKDYNLAQTRELASKLAVQKQQDDDDKKTQMANLMYGDFLTENPAAAQSAFGAHRVIPSRWKGMNPEQIVEIRRIQDVQRKENERKREEEKQRNNECDRIRNAQARAGTIIERERERQVRDLASQQAEENRRLSKEQQSYQEYLNKSVYTNGPTASYFMQFNTTTR